MRTSRTSLWYTGWGHQRVEVSREVPEVIGQEMKLYAERLGATST